MCRVCDGEGCVNCTTWEDAERSAIEKEQREEEWAAKGYIGVCFTAGHVWGECTCQTSVPEDEGFEFEGTNITDPCVSECGRFFVDPEIYYGEAYTVWKEKRNG